MTVTVQPVPMLSDNYAWLLRETVTGAVAIADPPDAAAAIKAIDASGGRLDLILLTHHHGDHTAGADELRTHYAARIAGARADAHRLPKLDIELAEGDELQFGNTRAVILETPGHTRGHIAFFFPLGNVLLCGDTLFSVGCGRLLEGTAEEMFASLKKLSALPDETLVACGHEYTASNVQFALTVEPDNMALHGRALEVMQLRAAGQSTVPSMLAQERATNPFLRAPTAARLAEIRTAKDNF